MSDAVDELADAVFQRVALDERHRDAMTRALRWSSEQRLFPGKAASATRACVNAATYARLCAPRSATARELELATTFTVWFFWLDDADPTELRQLIDQPWPEALQRMPALAAWRAGADELERCRPELAAVWLDSLRGYLGALLDELAVDPKRITSAEQHELRRRNAFIDPYLDLWLALLDVAPPAADVARARWIAREIIIIANDLGSLARDLAADEERPELNLVITAARERGCSHGEATVSFVEQHDALVDELSASLAELTRVGGEPGRVYAELLRQVVTGNIAAMRVLAERYGGAAPLLDALAVPR